MIIDLHRIGEPTPKGCYSLKKIMSSLRDLVWLHMNFYNPAIPSGLVCKVSKVYFSSLTTNHIKTLPLQANLHRGGV